MAPTFPDAGSAFGPLAGHRNTSKADASFQSTDLSGQTNQMAHKPYNTGMKWIVTHALPPAALSQSLEQALLNLDSGMPAKLARLFGTLHAQMLTSPVSEHGCTPAERLLLQTQGCLVNTDNIEHSGTTGSLPLASGSALAALEHGIQDPHEPVWIAQACATLISAERATLLPLSDLQASEEDLHALHEAISPLLGEPGDPFELQMLTPGNWRVRGNLPEQAWLPTPCAVRGQDLGDWWPTDDAWRPWRRLLNEIQMCWHDHPVNERRAQQGLPAINGVWLYGGAPGWTPAPDADVRWITELTGSAQNGDWAEWLSGYARIIDQLLQEKEASSESDKSGQNDFELILTGDDRIVCLRSGTGKAALRVFGQSSQTQPRTQSVSTSIIRSLKNILSHLRYDTNRSARPDSGQQQNSPSNSPLAGQHPKQSWSHWWNNV